MLQLEILDHFDFFMKIDDEIRFLKPLDEDFINEWVVPKRSVVFHSMGMTESPSCALNLNVAISSFLGSESSLCQVTLFVVRKDNALRREMSIYDSNFIGGCLGLFSLPEMLHFSKFWYNYEPVLLEQR